jgi:outer membrane scaffolding protein for murein synthesis (MipA/OmpV family)
VNIFKTRTFAAGPYLTYDLGRDESEDSRLQGTGDVDGTFEAGIFAELTSAQWRLSADYFQALLEDGHDGSRLVFSGAYGGRVTDQLGISVGGALTYASENYMESYFGVSAQQAAASGKPVFAAGGGFKDITGRIDLRYSATDHWFGLLRSEWKRLLGDADDTPLVDPDAENQFFVGTVAGYRF